MSDDYSEYFRRDASIPIGRLLGFGTGTFPSGDVCLVIEYQPREGQASQVLRLALTRKTAGEMSADLAIIAQTPHAEPPDRLN